MRPPPQMVIPAQPVYMAPAPQFAAPIGMPMHPPAPPGAIPMPRHQDFQPPEEPPSKKIKSGEDNLMPEADFLARNVSPVTFRVAVPNAGDKTEWNLNGQTLTVTLSLSDPITALKAKIHEETMMPPG